MRATGLAWLATFLAAACGEAATSPPGPLDRLYMPTGLAVHGGRLIAVSSNADLRYDDESGGAVLSIDPAGAGPTLGVNIQSFAGDLALASDREPDAANPDPAACGSAIPGPLAITATRGSNTLNAVLVEPAGLSCHACGVPVAGGRFSDPLAVTVACGEGRRPRAFVGYLSTLSSEAWISEYDLQSGDVRSRSLGIGPVRALRYDAARDRLYVIGLATGSPTPLRWVELGGGCRIDLPPDGGGCTVGEAMISWPSAGVELRSIDLAGEIAAGRRRAFLTGRLYDLAAAAAVGARVNDYGGVLLVVDLVENARGGVNVEVRHGVTIGRGAQDVRVLPRSPAWPAERREIVAALAADDGSLWIYDDETRAVAAFTARTATGASEFAREPFGLAVDPEPVGTAARVYVGSFRESHVVPVEVPFDAPGAARVASPGRITGVPR